MRTCLVHSPVPKITSRFFWFLLVQFVTKTSDDTWGFEVARRKGCAGSSVCFIHVGEVFWIDYLLFFSSLAVTSQHHGVTKNKTIWLLGSVAASSFIFCINWVLFQSKFTYLCDLKTLVIPATWGCGRGDLTSSAGEEKLWDPAASSDNRWFNVVSNINALFVWYYWTILCFVFLGKVVLFVLFKIAYDLRLEYCMFETDYLFRRNLNADFFHNQKLLNWSLLYEICTD